MTAVLLVAAILIAYAARRAQILSYPHSNYLFFICAKHQSSRTKFASFSVDVLGATL